MNRNTRISRNRNKNKNKRNRSLGKQSKNRKRSSKNRRQRLSRNRQRSSRNRRRQRGGFFTTSVSPIEANIVTTSSSNDVSSAQNCNLRNNANIFQSTFDNTPNNVAPNLDNYLLVNNDVYVSQ